VHFLICHIIHILANPGAQYDHDVTNRYRPPYITRS